MHNFHDEMTNPLEKGDKLSASGTAPLEKGEKLHVHHPGPSFHLFLLEKREKLSISAQFHH